MSDKLINGERTGERESSALIVREAAQCLSAFIEKVRRETSQSDYMTLTMCMLAEDHVKKMAWVHQNLTR